MIVDIAYALQLHPWYIRGGCGGTLPSNDLNDIAAQCEAYIPETFQPTC